MAGVKGRSGGARPNSGPKKKPPQLLHAPTQVSADAPEVMGESTPVEHRVDTPSKPGKPYVSPLDFLESVYQNEKVDLNIRLRAATSAAAFVHIKKTDEGKKAARAEKASEVGEVSKFTPGKKPALRAVGEN